MTNISVTLHHLGQLPPDFILPEVLLQVVFGHPVLLSPVSKTIDHAPPPPPSFFSFLPQVLVSCSSKKPFREEKTPNGEVNKMRTSFCESRAKTITRGETQCTHVVSDEDMEKMVLSPNL